VYSIYLYNQQNYEVFCKYIFIDVIGKIYYCSINIRMKILRKILLGLCLCTSAQAIEFTVHHATGGPSDRVTRLITKNLPTGYSIQNRPGAAGRIAVKHILQSDSVLMATVPQIYVTNPLMFKDLEYNPDSDLEILGIVAVLPNVLICNSKLGIKTFDEFLSTTKSLSFAINGYGSSEHIASESLFVHAKGKHLVIPYPSGGNKGALDVIGGSVDCTFGNYAGIKAIMSDSRITVLFTSHDMGDKVLTWEQYFKEPFPYQSYVALVVSKSMEYGTKKKIVNDVSKVFSGQEFKDTTFSTGLLPIGSTEQWMINSVLKSNKVLTRFIQNNKLEIKQ
jgi:tripartite-type tricarboxylate transporter receptor subunit TctC